MIEMVKMTRQMEAKMTRDAGMARLKWASK
jgi:hypothetical protein